MGSLSLAGRDFLNALAWAMRAVRERHGWRTSAAAQALKLDKRSYERLEAGRTAVTVERLMRFAEVTQSDPLAIVTAAVLRQPRLASAAARNKLLLTQALALNTFFKERGDAIADLDVATIMAAAAQMYRQLGEHLDKREAMLAGLPGERPAEPE